MLFMGPPDGEAKRAIVRPVTRMLSGSPASAGRVRTPALLPPQDAHALWAVRLLLDIMPLGSASLIALTPFSFFSSFSFLLLNSLH